ncbi:hypothetical protein [Rothia sp. CCM 9418]|uniref:hypothetical protein n=1 Tax=unclassified Rothia (in: high G+C Gram-positive bacteria) TaxID=2689056 RepID=UPI003AC517B4
MTSKQVIALLAIITAVTGIILGFLGKPWYFPFSAVFLWVAYMNLSSSRKQKENQ